MKRPLALLIAGLSALLVGLDCRSGPEWLTEGDPIDPVTGAPYEIVPGAPRISVIEPPPPRTRERETEQGDPSGRDPEPADPRRTPAVATGNQPDESTEPRDFDEEKDDDESEETTIEIGTEIGDIDLVIRSIAAGPSNIPPSAPMGRAVPRRTASRRGSGSGVPFTVYGSTGTLPLQPPPNNQEFPEHPVLVLAFADLDGDGFVGVTLLDDDPFDRAIEEGELTPIARRYSLVDRSTASGELFIPVGGPPNAELDIVLAAVTYAGPRLSRFYGGGVPMGPAIMTKLPFHPITAPQEVLGTEPTRAHADALVGAVIEALVDFDPANPAIGEAFTMRLDGSQPSIDTARVQSGEFVRFALAQTPNVSNFCDMPARPLRPGLDRSGARTVYELLHHLTLPDDGPVSSATLQVVPIDEFGNITAPDGVHAVEIAASGAIRILWPETDGDPMRETILIDSARGAEIVVDDLGGQWDDPDAARLDLSGDFPQNRLEVSLPDPDVDDSGIVDQADLDIITSAMDTRLGEEDFEWSLDLDGSGRIRASDFEQVQQALGQRLPTP